MDFATTITKEDINKLPIINFKGPVDVINNQNKAVKVAKLLLKEKELGFDTECRPAFRKGEHYDISLLQLSTDENAYLFRLNKFEMPSELIELLSSESIKKVGVAVRDDIIGLKKLKKFKDGGFIEIAELAKKKKIVKLGLRSLAAITLGQRLSKKAQLSNWENKRLSDDQVKYAATDAWIGLKIYKKLL